MLRQLAFGSMVSLVDIAVHAMTMLVVIRVARHLGAQFPSLPALRLSLLMMGSVAVLMAAHLCEISIWALAYTLVEATPKDTDRLYFAFVNYTTLGYGDIVPVPRWRLLGPMTAMSGMLLFGWSTAVIFEILNVALRRK